VIIERVVRRVLVVPLDLAGVGVERDRAVGIEVVAGTILGVPIRTRVADAPDDRVGRRIVGAGDPGRTAAVGGRPVVILPGIAAGLALQRDRVGAPDLLHRREVGGGEPAANAVFGAGRAGNRHALHDQWRAGDDLALVGVGNLALRDDFAGFLV